MENIKFNNADICAKSYFSYPELLLWQEYCLAEEVYLQMSKHN